MENAIVVHDPMVLGKTLAASGYFADARDAAQAAVKVMAGAEIGFGPIASMTGINIIKGKVTLSANIMAAAVKRSAKYDYVVKTLTETECQLEFYQGETMIGASQFTMADAKQAGLATGDNWRKFPKNMLFARAISNGAKWYCPDVFGGGPIYTPDELGATVDGETGEIVNPPSVKAKPIRESLIDDKYQHDGPERRLVREVVSTLEGPLAELEGRASELPAGAEAIDDVLQDASDKFLGHAFDAPLPKGVEATNEAGYCLEHKTAFFKTENMNSYAHQIKGGVDDGKWCHKHTSSDSSERPAKRKATPQRQTPSKTRLDRFVELTTELKWDDLERRDWLAGRFNKHWKELTTDQQDDALQVIEEMADGVKDYEARVIANGSEEPSGGTT